MPNSCSRRVDGLIVGTRLQLYNSCMKRATEGIFEGSYREKAMTRDMLGHTQLTLSLRTLDFPKSDESLNRILF